MFNGGEVMAIEVDGFENELLENQVDGDSLLNVTSCVNPQLVYAKKDSANKQVTFVAKGTPGSSITLYIYKFLGNLYSAHYTTLDSTGYRVLTYTVDNGSYEAVLLQSGSCGGTYGPLFFTMN